MSISRFSSTKAEYAQVTSVFLYWFFSGQEVADTLVGVSHTPNILVGGEGE